MTKILNRVEKLLEKIEASAHGPRVSAAYLRRAWCSRRPPPGGALAGGCTDPGGTPTPAGALLELRSAGAGPSRWGSSPRPGAQVITPHLTQPVRIVLPTTNMLNTSQPGRSRSQVTPLHRDVPPRGQGPPSLHKNAGTLQLLRGPPAISNFSSWAIFPAAGKDRCTDRILTLH